MACLFTTTELYRNNHDTLHAERRCGGAWSRHPTSWHSACRTSMWRCMESTPCIMTPYIMTLFMQNVDVEVHGVNTLHRDTLHHDTLHAECRCQEIKRVFLLYMPHCKCTANNKRWPTRVGWLLSADTWFRANNFYLPIFHLHNVIDLMQHALEA